MSLDASVGSSYQTFDGIIVELFVGELSVGLGLEHVITANQEKGSRAEENCSDILIYSFHNVDDYLEGYIYTK